jgi:SAM-dependent methyltransferase
MKYLRYFYFIARNWNLFLAAFTVRHEIRGEKEYNLDTLGLVRLRDATLKGHNLAHASVYQGANYFLLEKAFRFLHENEANNSITDFGCGKGRVLVVAAYFGFNMIRGVDFVEDLCLIAKANVANAAKKFPGVKFEIEWNDVAEYEIADDTNVFFFFNPFDEVIILEVVKKIMRSLKASPRQAYVVYLNPLHKEIFQSAGFTEVYYLKRLTYLELSILCLEEDKI